jgi:hypothetical protein
MFVLPGNFIQCTLKVWFDMDYMVRSNLIQ